VFCTFIAILFVCLFVVFLVMSVLRTRDAYVVSGLKNDHL